MKNNYHLHQSIEYYYCSIHESDDCVSLMVNHHLFVPLKTIKKKLSIQYNYFFKSLLQVIQIQLLSTYLNQLYINQVVLNEN